MLQPLVPAHSRDPGSRESFSHTTVSHPERFATVLDTQ